MKKIILFFFTILAIGMVNAQVLTEGFESGTFPPTGWLINPATGNTWETATTGAPAGDDASGTPFTVDPHTGAGMAQFRSYDFSSGTTADLISSSFSLSTIAPARVTFWFNQDNGYTNEDSVVVFINTSASLTGATRLGNVIRYITSPSQWNEFTFNFPNSFNTATNYLIFKAYSRFGNNMFLDDVVVEAQPSCLSPTTITAAPVNTTSITLNWPVTSGAIGYEYVLNSLVADPTGAGTALASNSVVVTGTYTLGNTYYAHVRTACTGATFSTWKTVAVIIPPLCTSNLLPANMATGLGNPVSLSWTASAGATSYNGFLSTDNGVTYTNVGNITGTTALLTLVSSGTYYWYVQPSNGGVASGCQSSVTSFTTLPTPPNDICTGATVIPCGGSVSGNNGFATNDLLPAITCGSATATVGNNRGVWFKVTPTLAGSLTVSACVGTIWDTYMRVYDGTCASFTSCVGFSDDACGRQSSVTFTAVANTTYYVLLGGFSNTGFGDYTISATCPALCNAPTAVSVSAITLTSASVAWTGAGVNIVEYGLTGFTPGTGATAGAAGTVINPATSPQAITGLVAGTAYQVYVRQDCNGAGNGYSTNSIVAAFTTLSPPPVNDEATGAISLTLGSGCTGAIYSNVSATQSALEPFPSCKGTAGFAGMWYKFVAPASGSVKVSCDEAVGTFGDSRMALYSATNVSDYTTFNIIACDDDNGVAAGARSLFYTSGLTPGNTYYVLVDLYNSFSTKGTYCISVDELAGTMIASTAGNCAADQGSIFGYNATYTGWITLVDAAGNLNANVRQTAGTATSFSSSSTITTGTPRQDATGHTYLNRNFLVSGSGATTADLQLYFNNADATALGGTVATYNVNRVAGATCNANFTGTATLLTQTASGSANGANYVQVATPGFSNFYIVKGAIILPSSDLLSGSKQGNTNLLDWKVSCVGFPEITIILERSVDGRTFETLQQQVASSVRCSQNFTYVDASPVAGINYYRIKIITPQGDVRYTSIVALINKGKGFELISLAPNPVTNAALLSLSSAIAGNVVVTVIDFAGKTLSKETLKVIAGNNPITLNFATLAAGTYTIVAKNADGEIKTTRFVKY